MVKIWGFDPLPIVDRRLHYNSFKRFLNPFTKRFVYERRKMLEEVFILGKETAETYTSTLNKYN